MSARPPAHPPGSAPVAAVIDVVSNSVLLLVVRVGPDGFGRVLDEALVTTRLAALAARGIVLAGFEARS